MYTLYYILGTNRRKTIATENSLRRNNSQASGLKDNKLKKEKSFKRKPSFSRGESRLSFIKTDSRPSFTRGESDGNLTSPPPPGASTKNKLKRQMSHANLGGKKPSSKNLTSKLLTKQPSFKQTSPTKRNNRRSSLETLSTLPLSSSMNNNTNSNIDSYENEIDATNTNPQPAGFELLTKQESDGTKRLSALSLDLKLTPKKLAIISGQGSLRGSQTSNSSLPFTQLQDEGSTKSGTLFMQLNVGSSTPNRPDTNR